MEIKYGLPQFFTFDMSVLPHGGDFSKWEEGEQYSNGWYDPFDQEGMGAPNWCNELNALRYKDNPYYRKFDSRAVKIYGFQYYYAPEHSNLIFWPERVTLEIDSLKLSPLAIKSDEHEFALLLWHLAAIEVKLYEKSIFNKCRREEAEIKIVAVPRHRDVQGAITSTRSVLTFQLQNSANKEYFLDFLRNHHPETVGELIEIMQRYSQHAIATLIGDEFDVNYERVVQLKENIDTWLNDILVSQKRQMEVDIRGYVKQKEQEELNRQDPVKLAIIQREENKESFDLAVKSLAEKADYYGKLAFSGTLEDLKNIQEDALKYESLLARTTAGGPDPYLNIELLKFRNECLLRIRSDNDLIKKRLLGISKGPVVDQNATSEKREAPKSLPSFSWHNTEELHKLYELVCGKLISGNTSKDQFLSVFSEETINTFEPILMLKGQFKAILYLLNQAMSRGGRLMADEWDGLNSNKFSGCFLKHDGTPVAARTFIQTKSKVCELTESSKIEVDNILTVAVSKLPTD